MTRQDQSSDAAKRTSRPAFQWHLLNAILSLTSGPFNANAPLPRHAAAAIQQNSELSSQIWVDMLCLHAEALDAADESSVIKILQTVR